MTEAASQLHMSGRAPHARDGADDLVALLEERLASLVERHREALKAIEELQTQLQDRHAQLADLTRRLDARDGAREEASRRIGGLLERLSQLETALSARTSGSARDGS